VPLPAGVLLPPTARVLLPPPPAGVLLLPPPPAPLFPVVAPLFFTPARLLLPTLPPLPTFESGNCSESPSSPSCSCSRSCSASSSSPSSSSNAAIEGRGLRFGLAPPPCVTVGVLKCDVWDGCEYNERGGAWICTCGWDWDCSLPRVCNCD
jgi:hypothetical protein